MKRIFWETGKAVSAILLSIVLLSACSANKAKDLSSSTSIVGTTADPAFGRIDLDETSATGVPPGANDPESEEELLARLRDALEKAIEESGADKRVAAAPQDKYGYVADLTFDEETNILTWSYMNLGDYNLDGEVSLSDIRPIAIHYGVKPNDGIGNDARESWIDGDNSGEIGISDIAIIAANYLSNVSGYTILTSDDPAGDFESIGSIAFEDAVFDYPPRFQLTLPKDACAFVRVAPIDSDGTAGEESIIVSIGPWHHKPQSPSLFDATQGTLRENILLTWSECGGAEGYYVYRDSTSDIYRAILEGASFEDYVGTDPSSHTYWVSAFNSVGESELSGPHEGSPKRVPEILSVNGVKGMPGETITIEADIEALGEYEVVWHFGEAASRVLNTFGNTATIVLSNYELYYAASVTVKSMYGDVTRSFKITVASPPEILKINFPQNIRFMQENTFSADVVTAFPLQYHWYFEDALKLETRDKKPDIMFLKTGTKQCKLIVTGPGGTDESTFGIMVMGGQPPNISKIPVSFGFSFEPTSFSASLSNPDYARNTLYEWDFGKAGTPQFSDNETPIILLGKPGTYTCSLEVSNEFGSSSMEFTLNIFTRDWQPEKIEQVSDLRQVLAIYDSTGALHFCHLSRSYSPLLTHIWLDSGVWHEESIEDFSLLGLSNCMLADVATDSMNNLHIVVLAVTGNSDAELYYYTNAAGTWTSEHISTPFTNFRKSYYYIAPSIAIDGQDVPHICYRHYTQSPSSTTAIAHAWKPDTSWLTEDISEEIASVPSNLVIDANDALHIIYAVGNADTSGYSLCYAFHDESGWTNNRLQADFGGPFQLSLDIDSNDNLHMAIYTGYYLYRLYYGYSDGTSAHFELVDILEDHFTGFTPIVRADDDNRPAIIYGDTDNYLYAIKYAEFTGERWSIGLVDVNYEYYQFFKLMMNPDGDEEIYYIDWTRPTGSSSLSSVVKIATKRWQ
ncbi:PKD domain-containing protein [bacterium]|nr:PKD domain-containing protein [bacterium]